MIMLRIIGIVVCTLEATAFITWAVNGGVDRFYFSVFWKTLRIVLFVLAAVCVFVATIVMTVDPSAIINLFHS